MKNYIDELDEFWQDAEREKGYKAPIKFNALFDGVELELPNMQVEEPVKPMKKIIATNVKRNAKPGLF